MIPPQACFGFSNFPLASILSGSVFKIVRPFIFRIKCQIKSGKQALVRNQYCFSEIFPAGIPVLFQVLIIHQGHHVMDYWNYCLSCNTGSILYQANFPGYIRFADHYSMMIQETVHFLAAWKTSAQLINGNRRSIRRTGSFKIINVNCAAVCLYRFVVHVPVSKQLLQP